MNENALIIGGSGDIGSSIVKVLTKKYNLDVTSRDTLDLSSRESIEGFIAKNDKVYDFIVFCAAENIPEYFSDLKYENIQNSIQVNLLSITEILHTFYNLNKINSRGSIVIISSLYAYFGRIKRLPYSVSKHALNGLVKNLAIELCKKNIRVNSVSPGFIDTKLTRRNLSNAEISKITKIIPDGKLGMPDDIANVVKFLLSKDSSYINGQDIVVDGGFMSGGFLGTS